VSGIQLVTTEKEHQMTSTKWHIQMSRFILDARYTWRLKLLILFLG